MLTDRGLGRSDPDDHPSTIFSLEEESNPFFQGRQIGQLGGGHLRNKGCEAPVYGFLPSCSTGPPNGAFGQKPFLLDFQNTGLLSPQSMVRREHEMLQSPLSF